MLDELSDSQAGESSISGDGELERMLESASLWEEAGGEQHLNAKDMLFALAKAGGGMHLKQCVPCRGEAQIIEDVLEDFEAGRIKPVGSRLRKRLHRLPRTGKKAPRSRTSAPLLHVPADPALWSGKGDGSKNGSASQSSRRSARPALSRSSTKTEAVRASEAAIAARIRADERRIDERRIDERRIDERRADQPRADELTIDERQATESLPSQSKSDRAKSRRQASRRISGRRRRSSVSRRQSASGVSGRKKTATSLRPAVRRPRQVPFIGVFAGLAAAAALLLSFTLFSSPSATPPTRRLSKNRPNRGPLVSDVLERDATRAPSSERPTEAPVRPEVDEPERPFPEIGPAPEAPKTSPEPERRGPAPEGVTTTEPEAGPKPAPEPAPEVKKPVDPVAAFDRRSIEDDGSRLVLATNRVFGRLALRRKDSDKWQNVRRGQAAIEVAPGDRLRARGGPVFMTLASGTELDLCLDQKTEVQIEGAKDGPVLGVGQGRIHCDFEQQFRPERLVVQTPHGALASAGSTFGVEVNNQHTITNIYEGALFSVSDSGSVPLEAGLAYQVEDGAAESKGKARARASAWSRAVRPSEEVLFRADFENEKLNAFKGRRVRRESQGYALRALPVANKHYGFLAHLRRGAFAAFRATDNLKIRFSYRLSQRGPLLIQLYNDTQKKSFKQSIARPKVGRWTRASFSVMDFSTYYAPGRDPVQKLDLFTEVKIFGGEPGSDTEFEVDGFEIYRKNYR